MSTVPLSLPNDPLAAQTLDQDDAHAACSQHAPIGVNGVGGDSADMKPLPLT
jgi:hypothetical protein